jgi:hypothetical protein
MIRVAHPAASRTRRIGTLGTLARAVVGVALLGSVTYGHVAGDFRPLPWILGLFGLPGVVLGWQRWRSRRKPERLVMTGPVPHVLNVVAFLALYLIPLTSDAALMFYGGSMLVAAVRGYAGCEVLAVSNWLLGRDDQVGCLLFAPVDLVERTGGG